MTRWMAANVAFRNEVLQAEAEAEMLCIRTLRGAITEGDVKAAQWWLERRRSEDWGRIDRLEVSTRQQAEALAAELGVPVDEVIREAERIANRR